MRELSTAACCKVKLEGEANIAARRRTLIVIVLAANLLRNSVETLALIATVL